MIKVTNKVNVYEINNEKVDWQRNSIAVKSHWDCPGQVVLEVGDRSYTVIVRELEAAIKML